jgi:receptor protein-tyrosine kinase
VSIIERAVRRLKTAEAQEAARAPEVLRERGTATPTPLLRGAHPQVDPTPRAAPHLRGVVNIKSPVGEIDLGMLERAGMIVPDGKRTQISEEFRVIKRTLLQNAKRRDSAAGRSSNLILLTSAFPDEGKTFSSINLAISMSLEVDHSVLLVDADVAQPRPDDFLGLKSSKGLMDLLVDPKLSLAEVVIRTNIDRLDVLLAGSPHPQATELLASESMNRLLGELAAQWPERLVVFDAPPLLVTTEAGVLAQRAGQVVMVVEAGKTTHTALKSALAQLEGCSVFALLNKTTRTENQDMRNYSRYRYRE